MCGKENNKYNTKNHLCGILFLCKIIEPGIVGNEAANGHNPFLGKGSAGYG